MYFYRVVPFGLKNAKATHLRMMSHMFEPLLGKIVEAYIDGILVKSKSRGDHLDHLWGGGGSS